MTQKSAESGISEAFKGGLPREEKRMELFQKTLEECQLNDVGFSGRWFAWERGNLPETNIRERLDRGVANTKDSFNEEVKNLWGRAIGDLSQKLEFLRIGLKRCAGQIRTNRNWKKEMLIKKLSELVEAERDDRNLANMIDAKIQLNFEIEKKEYYWEQRAQLNWLQLGDRNTAFFHSHATQMRKKNQIKKLQNDNGEFTKNVREIEDIARVYFENLFKARRTAFNEHIFSSIKRCIFDEDNSKLLAPYEEVEIRGALFEMGSTKAPVEDVFPTPFYQRCWDIIGSDVVSFCLNLLNGKMEVSSINATQIM
ncbi:uncharacterized protein [Gossypium hirsutum]|uniref:Reverse transcriptase n=1 Tax=Gossypium hirsutum TaxID=3635 RepID=A0A1U8IJI0_GOSHI|nr:uncharacterized protein LOC107895813 [Gossypium hirsutum]